MVERSAEGLERAYARRPRGRAATRGDFPCVPDALIVRSNRNSKRFLPAGQRHLGPPARRGGGRVVDADGGLCDRNGTVGTDRDVRFEIKIKLASGACRDQRAETVKADQGRGARISVMKLGLEGLILPIALLCASVNQMSPLGPDVIPNGLASASKPCVVGSG